MKNKIFIIILMVTFCISSIAYSSISGEGGGDFLKKGIGARVTALGGTFVAISDDANATYWNPAGLSLIKNKEIWLMTTQMFGVKYNNIVYAQKVKNGGFGLFWLNAYTGGIEGYDINMNPTGTFSYTADAFYLSYGRKIQEKLSAGLSLKYISQKLQDSKGDGFGFDLGLLYKHNKSLTFGVNLQDITETNKKWSASSKVQGSQGADDKIPLNIKFGLSYKCFIKNKPLTLAMDLDKTKDKKEIYHLGIEYQLNEMLHLRFGLDDGFFSAGTGMKLGKFQLDYSFNQHTLDNTNKVSLGYSF